MQIFRVEKTTDNFGPYFPRPDASETFYRPDLTHYHDEDRPVPWHDFDWIDKDLLVSGKSGFDKIRFGFRTINQLRNWFTDGTLKFLNNKGYWIAIYEATVLESTEHQAAFDFSQAEFMGYRNFNLRQP